MTASARRTNATQFTRLTASFARSRFCAFLSPVIRPRGRSPREPAAPALDGVTVPAQYRGKVAHLDFWASWCAPCLKAIPEIEAMRKELASDGFQVVAVNLDTSPKKALRFLAKNPIGYPSASDPKGRLPKQFGVDTMPTSYLIDGEGVIRYVHRGFQRGDGTKLRAEIKKLLGGR
jgi:thiol-disulfide isomerase/thioredoxin